MEKIRKEIYLLKRNESNINSIVMNKRKGRLNSFFVFVLTHHQAKLVNIGTNHSPQLLEAIEGTHLYCYLYLPSIVVLRDFESVCRKNIDENRIS